MIFSRTYRIFSIYTLLAVYHKHNGMKKIEREDLYILSQHSDLSEELAAKVLREQIYSDKAAWQKFMRLLFISLAFGFSISGIVFFFAYNWADLYKFAKIGITEAALIGTTLLALHPKINSSIRPIILTAAAALVGVLFAVFGQVYQTGANAYDFFLAWTLFISVWVFLTNYPPLSLLYWVLINTTLILYTQQVAKDWSPVFVFMLLFLLNVALLTAAHLLSIYKSPVKMPTWFLYCIAIAAASFATIGMLFAIFDSYVLSIPIFIVAIATAYGFALLQAVESKRAFYLALIPLSLIIIASGFLIKISDSEGMFLLISLFIIGGITMTIRNIIHLQKKWRHEK